MSFLLKETYLFAEIRRKFGRWFNRCPTSVHLFFSTPRPRYEVSTRFAKKKEKKKKNEFSNRRIERSQRTLVNRVSSLPLFAWRSGRLVLEDASRAAIRQANVKACAPVCGDLITPGIWRSCSPPFQLPFLLLLPPPRPPTSPQTANITAAFRKKPTLTDTKGCHVNEVRKKKKQIGNLEGKRKKSKSFDV